MYEWKYNLVNQLINHGANVNGTDNPLFIPLTMACMNQHYDIAKILIENGAKINTKDMFGATPLLCALYHNQIAVAEYFLLHGADINAINSRFNNNFAILTSDGKKFLLEHGISKQTTNQNRLAIIPVPALTDACKMNDTGLVRLLLIEHGDDNINKKTYGLYKPMYYACKNNNLEILNMLIAHGASLIKNGPSKSTKNIVTSTDLVGKGSQNFVSFTLNDINEEGPNLALACVFRAYRSGNRVFDQLTQYKEIYDMVLAHIKTFGFSEQDKNKIIEQTKKSTCFQCQLLQKIAPNTAPTQKNSQKTVFTDTIVKFQ